MKKLVIMIAMLIAATAAFAKMSPTEMLKASDEKIFADFSSCRISIESEDDQGKISKQLLNGYKKGASKMVLMIKEPKRSAGNVEMRKENSIWVYFASNGKTMKSAFQSLAVGETVSYGDILSADLSYDYDVAGEVIENDTSVTLTLKPKPNHEGYAKLVVTLDKNTLLPQKKEYYALSGTVLKICEIKKIEFDEKGNLKIFQQQFTDPIKEKKSFVTMDSVKVLSEKDIPEKYYNETQLKFLSNQ